MPKLIAPEVINDIQERCDIVELISSYIPLKKAGRNFKATCPFHNEKTPSFVVSPEKQIYHCFGCGEGGSALNFLMKYERMDFKEAVQTLAKMAGVPLQFEDSGTDKEKSYISELYRINEIAADFYHSNLLKNSGPELTKYLASRKISSEALGKFKFGLAPNQWDSLIKYLRAKSINLKLIEEAGLIIAKESGGFYDRFRNRLIIPIYDLKNRVVAFGARALDESLPKYINSPETKIYVKGKNLFGLNLAKDAIRDSGSCLIAEGYFDVITPMQEGWGNIVCSSGTALTTEQIRLLKRYTKNVVVVYDSDKAGQLATLRSLDLFLEEEFQVKVVDLPKGSDPDLFVRKFGMEKFRELIDKAADIFDYKLKVLLGIYDVKNVNDKSKIAVEMLTMIKRVKNEVLRSEYVKLLSERISADQSSLLKELDKIKISQSYSWPITTPKNFTYTYPKAERMLVKLVLEDLNITNELKEFINPRDLQDLRLQKILELVFNLKESLNQLKPHQLINYLDDEKCVNLVSELTNEETLSFRKEDRNNILLDCIKRIKTNSINNQCQVLHTRIKDAQSSGDSECVNRLMNEFNLLIKKRGKFNEKIGN